MEYKPLRSQKLMNEDQTDWDDQLDGALFSIRAKPHSTTKFSPFFLLYGREALYSGKLPENFEVVSMLMPCTFKHILMMAKI